MHLKQKDPRSPTIPCIIGNSKIDKALMDLGDGVNLLPYTVYEQLGLGELKPKLFFNLPTDLLLYQEG
jgi:hypothetical protein